MGERCESYDVIKALENRFNPPSKPRQYATFTEVSDGDQRRRVDFLAVNLWQSRGRDVQGVEVKVARADWLKELAHPKADTWWGVSNKWWIAAPQGVLHEHELPVGWGFLECRRHADGWRLFVKREAQVAAVEPEWPRWLVMRLLTRGEDRRKAEPAELRQYREEADAHARARYEQGLERGKSEARYDTASIDELRRIHQALGVASWDWEHKGSEARLAAIKRAIEMLDTGRLEIIAGRTADEFRRVADSIEAAITDNRT